MWSSLRTVWASNTYLRCAVLVTASITIAYAAGLVLPHTSEVIAAVAAAVSVQPTLHSSVKEVAWQLTGLVVGVLVAVTLATLWDAAPLVLAVGVFAGFTLGRLLRVQESSAVGIVVPILKSSPRLKPGDSWLRLPSDSGSQAVLRPQRQQG